MKLSYKDGLPGGQAERKEVEAEITTWHPTSHYGQPALVLDDGNALDLLSWTTLDYRVEQATEEEQEQLKGWLRLQTYHSTGSQTEL